MAKDTTISYSKNNPGIIPEFKTLVNYNRRIATAFEDIIPELTNDPLTSVTSKIFLTLEFNSSTLTSNKVLLNGLNNLWLDTVTKKLTI